MKSISAICCWAVGVWLGISIVLSLAFPGTGYKLRSAATGVTISLDWQDELVMVGPMLAGA